MTDSQFSKVASFFQKIKILHGNDYVNSTLRRHSALNNSLKNYERERILELEREILKEELVQ